MPTNKRTFSSYNAAWGSDEAAGDRKQHEEINLGDIGGTITKTIFRAKSEVLIKQIGIVVSNAVAANDTNYWTFAVNNITKGTTTLISTNPTTQVTGGNAIEAYTTYNFNPDQFLLLAPDDVLQLVATKTASAVSLGNVVVFTEYEVTGETTTTSTSTTVTTSTSTSTTLTTTTSSTTTVTTSTTLT